MYYDKGDYDQALHDFNKSIELNPTHAVGYFNRALIYLDKSELDLAARRAIGEIEGDPDKDLQEYANPGSGKYCAMVEKIRCRLNLSSLKYQKLEDLVEAIGLPKEKLCTYCWDGAE